MPTVFIWKGLRFFFYSNECNEPPHVHVQGGGCEAKIWLSDLAIARNRGFTEREMRDIVDQIVKRRQQVLDAWSQHLGR